MESSNYDIEQEEIRHFKSIIRTFKNYRAESVDRISRSESYLNTLPNRQQEWLKQYRSDLQSLRSCIEHNAAIIECMIKEKPIMFENDGSINSLSASYGNTGEMITEGVDKVQATLKQIARDWSSDGEAEREQCYKPIIDEIVRLFYKEGTNLTDTQILVPGAGLGRLTFEIASRGFSCQGNEFNYFMLIVSYFVLNGGIGVNELTIYPWIQQHVNNLSSEHQMAPISFPDVQISDRAINPKYFSMAAGDFIDVYKTENEWDCVATCFFIDCAHNVVEFIEAIYKIIKPGGYWINLGPLLYHFAGSLSQPSIEPSFDALKCVIKGIGFKIEKCQTGLKTRYCQNPHSMLINEYDSIFFTCQKP